MEGLEGKLGLKTKLKCLHWEFYCNSARLGACSAGIVGYSLKFHNVGLLFGRSINCSIRCGSQAHSVATGIIYLLKY